MNENETGNNGQGEWIRPERNDYYSRGQWSHGIIQNDETAVEDADVIERVEKPKDKRTVGLVPALAMTLVAAVTSGVISGVVVSQSVDEENSVSTVSANLNKVNSGTGSVSAGDVSAVAAKVLPAVVSIEISNGVTGSEGSGSIISSDGYILTNNHVVEDAADPSFDVVVMLNDGTRLRAEFVAGDPNTDVAVIKAVGVTDLPTVEFGDSSQLVVGQEVVAVGSPLGLSATVTSGIVSAVNRPVRASGGDTGQSSLVDAIQTDAAINPGNSGGPLVDIDGNVIGMNTMIASTSSMSGTAGSIGLGFAIPANFARRVAQQLIESGQASQPMIGIQVSSQSTVSGAQIAEVTPGSPGETAGLKAGEVVTRVGDRVIESADALITAVRSHDFGETITLTVVDPATNGSRKVEVTLTQE